MLVSLLVKMLNILVLCPVLLAAAVQTLTIDSQLGTSIEDCFDRISIGEQLPPDAIYRNVTELTTRECEHICKQDKQCQSYDYGVGAKGNATCNLSKNDEKSLKEKNLLLKHPDYDVYIRRIQCEQAPPSPIQPQFDDPGDGPGPAHRPVFRPVDDPKQPFTDDYLISGDLEAYGVARPVYKPQYDERPDDYSNPKPDFDMGPSYGAHKPQDIPYRPEKPAHSTRPDPYDVLQLQDPYKPDNRPGYPANDARPPYVPEKPEYHYIIRPNRKPRPQEDTSFNKPTNDYPRPGYGQADPGYPQGPRPYPDKDPYNRPRPGYQGPLGGYGQNSPYDDNSIHVEINDPPRPYKPPKPAYGQGIYGYGTYSSQNSYSQSQSSQSQYYGSTAADTGFGNPYRPDPRPERPGYGEANDAGYGGGSKPKPIDDRPVYGGDKPGYSDKPAYNDKPAYGNDKPGYGNDKPAYGNDKPGYGNDRPTYGNDRPGYGNDKPTYNDKPSYANDRPSYGGNKPAYGNDPSYGTNNKPAYGNDSPSYGGNKPAYGNDYGNDRPYSDDKPSYGSNRPSVSNDKPAYGNDRPAYGNDRPAYGNDRPAYGNDRPVYGNDQPSYGNNKPSYDTKPGYGNQASYGSNHASFSSQSSFSSNQASYGSHYYNRPLDTGYGLQKPSHDYQKPYGTSSYGGYGNNQSAYGQGSYGSGSYGSGSYGSGSYGQGSYGGYQGSYGSGYGSQSSQSSYYGSQGSFDYNTGSYGGTGSYGAQNDYNRPAYDNRPLNDKPVPAKPQKPKPSYENDDQDGGYNKPAFDENRPDYINPNDPGYDTDQDKPAYGNEKPNTTGYEKPNIKPVYEYDLEKPGNVPSYIARPGGQVVTSKPMAISEYEEAYGRNPGKEVYKACFRRVLAGKRALRSHVRKVVPCERLEDCRRECATEKRFPCESFNYRLDRTFRGKGLCELMTKPIEAFDLRRDFVEDKDFDFFELDRNSLEPNCPDTLRGPGVLHSGFLSSKPNRIEGEGSQSGWRDRYDGFDQSDRFGGNRRGGYGNRRYDDRFYIPYQINHGLARSNDDQELWGKYGGEYGGNRYYKDRNDYHKSVTHWQISSDVERPSYGVKPHGNTNFDYHNLGKNGGSWIGDRYGYGSWKRGRWNSSGHSGNPNGLDYGDSSFYKEKHHHESIDRSDDGRTKDCSSRRRPGMSLGTGAIRRALISRNVVECEAACFSEREFKCVSYSYRYSNSHGTDNCFLSERPYRGLELAADSSSDVYAMPQDQGCVTINYKPWVESECFWHVRSGSAVSDTAVRAALTVAGLGACEAECIRAHAFFCRGFSFRFDSPTIGDDLENCVLTSSPPTSLENGRGLRPNSGHELYARGNYGRGCEPALYDDVQQREDECYLQYDKAAKLSGGAIRGQARVKDEQACGRACNEAQFRCLSFSFNNNAPPKTDNCLLSEIRLFDLQRGVDYVHSADDWLFAFDLFNGQCWRKVHVVEYDDPAPEIPRPLAAPPVEDHYPVSGPSGPPSSPTGLSGPSAPSGPGYLPDHDHNEPPFIPASGPPSGPGYKPYSPGSSFKPGYSEPSGPGYKPNYPPSGPVKPYPEPSGPDYKPGYPGTGFKPGYNEPSGPGFKPDYSGPITPSFKPVYSYPEPSGPGYLPDSDLKPGFQPSAPPQRPVYRPILDTPEYLPGKPGYLSEKPGYLPDRRPGYPGANRPVYDERPARPTRPGYKPGYPDRADDEPISVSWRHYTVSGFPCRAGTTCAQNTVAGHWACEPEGGEIGSWDYCCAPTHRCGYSEGFHKPWCYVGTNEDQWRPCSEKYYPYHQHKVPHPSQGHQHSPGRPLPPGHRGYSRVPTESRPHIRFTHNQPQPGSGHWLPVSPSQGSDGPPPPGLGVPRYWPVAYLHKEPPPNTTYFRYNETQPQMATTTELYTTPRDISTIAPRPDHTERHRDEKQRNISDYDTLESTTMKTPQSTTIKIITSTTEVPVTQEAVTENITEVEIVKPESVKLSEKIKGIDDKLDDFSSSIEVFDLDDVKGEKLSDLKTLEAEERQIEEIGRILASRRGGKLVLDKRSQKELEAKSIAIDKELLDFNFGNRFNVERRGVIQKVSKDEIERERERERAAADKSLEVSETSFVRPPRVLSTTENIRKAIVNGKVFYDATIREQRDTFLNNSTRKSKNLRLGDESKISNLTSPASFGKKIIKARNVNPVRRVRRVYRKRYNPEEVRRRLLEREKSKQESSTENSTKI